MEGFGRLSLTEPPCHFELAEKLPKPHPDIRFKRCPDAIMVIITNPLIHARHFLQAICVLLLLDEYHLPGLI